MKIGVVFALADGCNWGERPRKAAKRATKKFIETVDDSEVEITSVKSAVIVLLTGFAEAHKSIIAPLHDRLEECQQMSPGATTMTAGILLEMGEDSLPSSPSTSSSSSTSSMDPPLWLFVYVNLGDCKVFHYNNSTGSITDLLVGNRLDVNDPTDPGGCLGGAMDKPDLRNLDFGYIVCQEGDNIFALSDGIYDNFDPQLLGVSPKEFLLENWDTRISSESKDHINQLKSQYMIKRMKELSI